MKTVTRDGGHRTQTPEAAFDRFRHLIDSHTGVLRHLRRLPTPPGGLLHTYQVQHSLVAVFDTLDKLRANEQAGSSGKGMTDAQARMSAVGEGLERYSAIWQGYEYAVRASYNELKPQAIHPDALLGFSARQYATRTAWNAACPSPMLFVPEPFDEGEVIAWVPVWSLARRQYRYIPARYGFFGYPDDGTIFCRADSNGNAAGATLEEAVVQGFYELVERDAVAIWFYNRMRRPGVDLASFGNAYFVELEQYYADVLRRDLHVLDVTTDLGFPCFVALSRRTGRKPEDLIKGYGCHDDPVIAIGRALTELNQVLYNVLEETAEGATRYYTRDPLGLEWLQTVTVAEHPYLAPDPERPLKTADDYRVGTTDDVLDDVLTSVRRAEAEGLEIYMLNLTRADIGLPVVKVIVPNLVHFWRRLGFRRLYDTPVKMGWCGTARREEEVNPWSIVD
ncbi:MAG: YcaO-like family protein [Rhodothermales bacterium]